MRRVRTGLARLRREESGFTIVEVVITAMMVAIGAVGVLTGLDGAAKVSGAGKSRAIAASLAEQDQERLRTIKASDLSNLRETNVKTVGGVAYTVVSRGDWVTDATGTASCTSGTNRADYLKTTSAVTWPNMKVRPVEVESLVSPRAGSFNAGQGSLAVEVNGGTAKVSDMPVNVTGAASLNGITNTLGCVLFGYLSVGSYTATLSQAGYVDPGGATTETGTMSVVANATSTLSLQYDRAGSMSVTFDTSVGGAPAQAAQAGRAAVAHSGLPAPGRRVFGTGTPQSTISATGLFPFNSVYGVFAGDCVGADPRTYAQSAGTVTVAPGGAYPVKVRVPALNLNVTRGGLPLNAARVRVTPTGSGCGGTTTYTTNTQGKLPSPGLPYGPYTVCADDGANKVTVTGVQNTVPGGSATVNLPIPTTGTTGVCA